MANTPAILLNPLTEDTYFVALVAIIVLIPLIVFICANVIVPFLDERAYLKMEIKRSDDEAEERYYKRKLKRLYLKHIPIIGRFFR